MSMIGITGPAATRGLRWHAHHRPASKAAKANLAARTARATTGSLTPATKPTRNKHTWRNR